MPGGPTQDSDPDNASSAAIRLNYFIIQLIFNYFSLCTIYVTEMNILFEGLIFFFLEQVSSLTSLILHTEYQTPRSFKDSFNSGNVNFIKLTQSNFFIVALYYRPVQCNFKCKSLKKKTSLWVGIRIYAEKVKIFRKYNFYVLFIPFSTRVLNLYSFK